MPCTYLHAKNRFSSQATLQISNASVGKTLVYAQILALQCRPRANYIAQKGCNMHKIVRYAVIAAVILLGLIAVVAAQNIQTNIAVDNSDEGQVANPAPRVV